MANIKEVSESLRRLSIKKWILHSKSVTSANYSLYYVERWCMRSRVRRGSVHHPHILGMSPSRPKLVDRLRDYEGSSVGGLVGWAIKPWRR